MLMRINLSNRLMLAQSRRTFASINLQVPGNLPAVNCTSRVCVQSQASFPCTISDVSRCVEVTPASAAGLACNANDLSACSQVLTAKARSAHHKQYSEHIGAVNILATLVPELEVAALKLPAGHEVMPGLPSIHALALQSQIMQIHVLIVVKVVVEAPRPPALQIHTREPAAPAS